VNVLWFGVTKVTQCFFFFFPCKNGVESRDHLFFQCNFSSRTIVNPPLDWHDVIDEGCSKWKTKNC
jgi:hypothetical protein